MLEEILNEIIWACAHDCTVATAARVVGSSGGLLRAAKAKWGCGQTLRRLACQAGVFVAGEGQRHKGECESKAELLLCCFVVVFGATC